MSALPKITGPVSSRHIPYGNHVSPSVLSTAEGDYLSVWHLAGRHSHGQSDATLLAWVEELNGLARVIGSAHVSLWHHVERRAIEVETSNAGNEFVLGLARRHADILKKAGLFANDHWITVVYQPEDDKAQSFFASREKSNIEDKLARQEAAIRALDEINSQIGNRLKAYAPRLQSTVEHAGKLFSEPGRFLARLVDGVDGPVPVLNAPMANYLASSRISIPLWGEIGEIRTPTEQRLFGMVELLEYEGSTGPKDLDDVLSLDFPLLISQSFTMLNRVDAIKSLKQKERRLEDSRDVAEKQMKEMRDAMNDLQAGVFVMGSHHMTIRVMGDAVPEVLDRRSRVITALQSSGVKPHAVDRSLAAALWAQLPANWFCIPRPANITSRNFWSFASMHCTTFGKATGNPWGDALAVLRAPDGSPVYVNFHATGEGDAEGERASGHTLLTGMTGAGKTVTLGFLLAQADRFKPTIVALDVDEGLKATIVALGGRYWTVRIGGSSNFKRNPFKCESTPESLSYLKRLVRAMAEATGERVTHNDQVQIDKAVDMVMRSDMRYRRLSLMGQGLVKARDDEPDSRATVYERLLPWFEGGEHGWAFDNLEDSFDLTRGRVFGFDLTAALNHPILRRPIVMDMLHLANTLNDGRRFLLVNDEGWRHLDEDDLASATRTAVKTGRKKDQAVIFSTQEASEALSGKTGASIAESAATFICLPNPQGRYEDYRRFLTADEFAVLAKMGVSSRQMLIKQGGASVTASLDLSGADELLVLSFTPDRAAILDQIIDANGHGSDRNIPEYIERVKRRAA